MSVKESGSGNTDHRIRPVARIHTDFPTKFGIPRQSGLTGELESRIVFEPEFSNPDAVRGIEEFSHLWLIWEFSENVRDPKKWSPSARRGSAETRESACLRRDLRFARIHWGSPWSA